MCIRDRFLPLFIIIANYHLQCGRPYVYRYISPGHLRFSIQVDRARTRTFNHDMACLLYTSVPLPLVVYFKRKAKHAKRNFYRLLLAILKKNKFYCKKFRTTSTFFTFRDVSIPPWIINEVMYYKKMKRMT